MTTATFERWADGYAIAIEGHAGYNPGGPDIVCAACSALGCTLLQAALELEAEGGLTELHQEGGGGALQLRMRPAAWARGRLRTAVEVIQSGFALLAQKYPEHVQLCLKSGE